MGRSFEGCLWTNIVFLQCPRAKLPRGKPRPVGHLVAFARSRSSARYTHTVAAPHTLFLLQRQRPSIPLPTVATTAHVSPPSLTPLPLSKAAASLSPSLSSPPPHHLVLTLPNLCLAALLPSPSPRLCYLDRLLLGPGYHAPRLMRAWPHANAGARHGKSRAPAGTGAPPPPAGRP